LGLTGEGSWLGGCLGLVVLSCLVLVSLDSTVNPGMGTEIILASMDKGAGVVQALLPIVECKTEFDRLVARACIKGLVDAAFIRISSTGFCHGKAGCLFQHSKFFIVHPPYSVTQKSTQFPYIVAIFQQVWGLIWTFVNVDGHINQKSVRLLMKGQWCFLFSLSCCKVTDPLEILRD
jgi:hypothetical protein